MTKIDTSQLTQSQSTTATDSTTFESQITFTDEDIQSVLDKLMSSGDMTTSVNKKGLTNETPSLQTPTDSATEKLRNLSTDALLTLLGTEERKSTIESGMTAIKVNAEAKQEASAEKISYLREQIELSEKSDTLTGIKKVFSWIGTVVSCVTAVATIAVGAVTLNPLLVAGGVCLAVTAANSVVQQITGESMWTMALEACGVGETASAIIGMCIDLAFTIVGAVLTFKGLSKIGDATKMLFKTITIASSLVTGTTQVVNGSLTIAQGNYDKQSLEAQSFAKLLEAVLAKLQQSQDFDTEHLKAIMEKYQKVIDGVQEVIDGKNDTTSAILSGGGSSAAMA